MWAFPPKSPILGNCGPTYFKFKGSYQHLLGIALQGVKTALLTDSVVQVPLWVAAQRRISPNEVARHPTLADNILCTDCLIHKGNLHLAQRVHNENEDA